MSNRHEEFLGNGSPVERLTSGESLVCPSRKTAETNEEARNKSVKLKEAVERAEGCRVENASDSNKSRSP